MSRKRVRRLYYHPESGSYFVEYPDKLSDTDAMVVDDVTGYCRHEIEAEKQGVTLPGWDIDDATEGDKEL